MTCCCGPTDSTHYSSRQLPFFTFNETSNPSRFISNICICSRKGSKSQAIQQPSASPLGVFDFPGSSVIGSTEDAFDVITVLGEAEPIVNAPKRWGGHSESYSRTFQRCVSTTCLSEAKHLHDYLVESGIVQNTFHWNSLIDMYVRCGSMVDARQVFETMAERNVFSWTLIIAGYVRNGNPEEAVELFWLMECEGVYPDNVTFVSVLGACTRISSLKHGKEIHAEIIKSGVKPNIFLGNALVDMYAKCGSITAAGQVFVKMQERDLVSWNSIITGCVQCGLDETAFQLFPQMDTVGMNPDGVTFVCILKSCARRMALEKGKQIHTCIIGSGYQSNIFIGSTLVDFYSKCGCMDKACQEFGKMLKRDIVSWNAIIGGYAKHAYGDIAFYAYRKMQQEGVNPNRITFMSILDACVNPAFLKEGKQVHSRIVVAGQESDIFVGNSLIDMYAKCESLDDAIYVFVRMPTRNVVSWNTMITGYAQTGHSEDAIMLFELMYDEHVKPNEVTFVAALHACANLGAVEQGKSIHTQAVDACHELSINVENTLIDMYSKCGSVHDARCIFDAMTERDVVSWNVMITGYVQHGHGEDALRLLQHMKQEGLKPNEVTFMNVLSVCDRIDLIEQGKVIHLHAIDAGYELDVLVGSSIVDMYGRCGSIFNAQEVFDRIPKKSTIPWNAIIAGYVRNRIWEEALRLFNNMQHADVMPDEFTFVSILNACSSLTALEQGEWIHWQIVKAGYGLNILVGSALVDMYAKCGRIEYARQLFDKMPKHDLITWTVMIAGYARHGQHQEVFELWKLMQQEGVDPDGVIFLCVLSACSHVGLMDEALRVFGSLIQDHGMIPTAEHFSCLVDLFGRTGCLGEAEKIIEHMPLQPGAVPWRTLLGACRNHGDLELAKHASNYLLKVNPKDAAAYVLLSNTYVAQP